MENQAKFLRQLRDVFRVEAEEHLSVLQGGIFDLEKAGPKNDSATIQRVFRAAHSLKGAARAVDFPDVESICHSIESLFSQVLKNSLVLASPIYDSLNGALDLLARILGGEASTPQRLKEVLAALEENHGKPAQAQEIIETGKADLILLARVLLRDPYWPLRAAVALGRPEAISAPPQYERGWAALGKVGMNPAMGEPLEAL